MDTPSQSLIFQLNSSMNKNSNSDTTHRRYWSYCAQLIYYRGKKINQLIQKQRPHIPLIIGGPHCTLLPERSLIDTQANICVQGDSETIIPDLVKALNKEKNFSDIPGVYVPTNQGMIQGSTPQTTKISIASHFPPAISSTSTSMVVSIILV